MLAAFEAAEFYTRVTGIPAARSRSRRVDSVRTAHSRCTGQERAAGQLHLERQHMQQRRKASGQLERCQQESRLLGRPNRSLPAANVS